jgi:hypothetical protein
VDILASLGLSILAFALSLQLQSEAMRANRELSAQTGFLEGSNQAELAAWLTYYATRAGALPADGSVANLAFSQERTIASSSSGCTYSGTPTTCPLSYDQTAAYDGATSLYRRLTPETLSRQASPGSRYCGFAKFPPVKTVHRVCLEPKTLEFSILANASGKFFNVSYDTLTSLATLTPRAIPDEPKSIAVKNLATVKKSYLKSDLCLFGICADSYFEDLGLDDSGKSYYLSTDGRILRAADNAVVHADPKIASIDFNQSFWLILRSDGAISTATNIEDPLSYNTIPGLFLPGAYKIVGGQATP